MWTCVLTQDYDELSAAPDVYPGIFNSGVMVLQPDDVTFRRMLQTYRCSVCGATVRCCRPQDHGLHAIWVHGQHRGAVGA